MTRKRIFDVLLTMVGAIVVLPVIAITALAVMLDRSGPVLYAQERVGRGGRTFRMLKFRTMYPGADRNSLLTVEGKAPITAVGAVLRRLKLDELPQLWNVLKGEMSLVGPRPEVPPLVALYTADQRRVLDLMPGITDPASIEYRNESDLLADAADPHKYYVDVLMPEKIRINMEYAATATVAADFRIILRTLSAVFG